MINGYLLRDVVNEINGIHFNSSEEIHTLGRLYESMLKEMRDAAGDSGEFYTPKSCRQVHGGGHQPRDSVKWSLTPPVEPADFWSSPIPIWRSSARPFSIWETLQKRSIVGGEAKSLPYLLAQMNLLLHGMDYPRISPGNSLDVKLSELGEQRPRGRDPNQPHRLVVKKRREFKVTSPLTNKPVRPHCCSTSSLCGNYEGCPIQAGPRWSFQLEHFMNRACQKG